MTYAEIAGARGWVRIPPDFVRWNVPHWDDPIATENSVRVIVESRSLWWDGNWHTVISEENALRLALAAWPAPVGYARSPIPQRKCV